MISDLNDFLEEYDELVQLLLYSRHQDFSAFLRRLFTMFDEAPVPVRSRLVWLATLMPWQRVEAEVIQTPKGMVGSGQLKWPDDRDTRLSAQMALLREFAEDRISAWNFAHDYFYTSSRNLDDILREMSTHLVGPFATELRRYLVRNYTNAIPTTVPASDRIVTINHNSAPYGDWSNEIDLLEEEMRSTNVAFDPDLRDRAIAELQATRSLLRARTIRWGAITFVLATLSWLGTQFAEAIFQPRIQALVELLRAMFPGLPI